MSSLAGPPGTGSPVRINRLGHLEIRSPDVAALATYYERVLGLAVTEQSEDAAYLTTGADHHCLAIRRGSAHGRAGLGLLVDGELSDVESALREAGLAVERRSDPEPGIGQALVVVEPLTDMPISLYENQDHTDEQTSLGLRPTKLGHVANFAPELGPLRAFYEEILGFRWSDIIGDFFVFLRCNADHHAVNIMSSTKRSGLHHAAFEVRDFVHLKDMLDQLARNEVRLEWGPGRHGAGHNIFTYHRDPDGNLVELFCELDVVHDETNGTFEPRPWHEEFPQGPRRWEVGPAAANKWGPINPEMLDH